MTMKNLEFENFICITIFFLFERKILKHKIVELDLERHHLKVELDTLGIVMQYNSTLCL